MGAGGGAEGGGGYSFLIMIALVFGVMYFFMIRPQAKKQKERQKMLDAVQKGDQVVTVGGVHGKVMGFKNDDKTLIVKVDDNVKLDIERTAISNVLSSK